MGSGAAGFPRIVAPGFNPSTGLHIGMQSGKFSPLSIRIGL